MVIHAFINVVFNVYTAFQKMSSETQNISINLISQENAEMTLA